MRILTNNYLPESTISINGPEPMFPVENLYSNILSEVTRYLGFISIDLGAAKQVTAIGLLNLTSGGIGPYQVRVQANSVDDFSGVTPFDEVVDDKVYFTDVTYRYWRFTSVSGRQIGYAYLGQYLQMPGNVGGSVPSPIRNDIITVSQSGARYITPGSVIRQQSFTFDTVSSKSEWDTLDNYRTNADYSNNHIFVQFEEKISGEWYFDPYFASILMTGDSRGGNLFSMNMSVVEAK